MERQAHGFNFEQYVSNKYGITLSGEYTSKWDGEYNGLPISIKHIANGNAVDLGDIFRQASITEPFYMLVGFYTDSNFDNDDIYLLHFNQNEWHQFFMDVDQFEDKFRGALDAVTNNKEDDDKWKILMNDCKNYWKEHTPNIVRPNGKRDHKLQKRWQCSICNSLFFKEIIPKFGVEED